MENKNSKFLVIDTVNRKHFMWSNDDFISGTSVHLFGKFLCAENGILRKPDTDSGGDEKINDLLFKIAALFNEFRNKNPKFFRELNYIQTLDEYSLLSDKIVLSKEEVMKLFKEEE